MDALVDGKPGNDGRGVLALLQENTEEVSRTFDLLPGELQMDGLDILQNLVTATVRKITMGKVSSVRFIPVQEKKKTAASPSAQCQENAISNSEIKEEEPDDDVELIHPDVIHDADGPVDLHLPNGVRDKSLRSTSARLPQQHQSPHPTSPGNPQTPENVGTPRNGASSGSANSPGSPAVGSDSANRVDELDGELSPLSNIEGELADHIKTEEDETAAIPELDKQPVVEEQVEVTPRGSARRAAWVAATRLREDSEEDGHGDYDSVSQDQDFNLELDTERANVQFSGDESEEDVDKVPGSASRKHYKCRYCAYTTNAKHELRSHQKNVHSGVRLYECEYCGQRFSAASSLKRHKLTHSGEKEHECPVCSKRFYQLSQLHVHSVVHTGERLYSCKKCSKCYTNSANLRRHNRIHTGEKPYACAECDARYRDYSSLKLHKLKHTGEKPYTCHVCSKQFKTSSDYRRHERTHTGERRYECPVCGKLFVQGWHLVQHARIHSNERAWSCDRCRKRFRTKASLQFHTRSHLGIKDYTCATCHKSFSTKKYLQLHQVVHTAARPYMCKTCGATFNQYPNMRRHERVHSDERRYACTVCGKRFKYSNSLQYHEGIHRGERSLCPRCGLGFRSKSGLQHHRCDPTMYAANLRKTVGAMRLVVQIQRLDPLMFRTPDSPTVEMSRFVDERANGSIGASRIPAMQLEQGSGHPRIVLKIPKKKLKKRSAMKTFQIIQSTTPAPPEQPHVDSATMPPEANQAKQLEGAKGRGGRKRPRGRPRKIRYPEDLRVEHRVVPPLRISTAASSPEAQPMPILLLRTSPSAQRSASPTNENAALWGHCDAGDGREVLGVVNFGIELPTGQAGAQQGESCGQSDLEVMKAAYI